MLNDKILGLTTVLDVALVLLFLITLVSKKEGVRKSAWTLLYVTFAIHTAGLLVRWRESYLLGTPHAPLSNLYESLIFYAWCLLLIQIVMKRMLAPSLSLCLCAAALFCMGFSSLWPSAIQPLIPALQSNWLHIHVLTCFFAYAAFAISFFCGIFYFLNLPFMPPKDVLEEINYRSVVVGFPMLSAGILTGAVWASYAWGSYWSWDPKESWSLITWIVYAIFLHARYARGWTGRRVAFLSIIGFASVIFTYFGVNLLLSGLHSYASS
jgi:ABC-type transport system involved in cytochrome c biogenesis permease subunit